MICLGAHDACLGGDEVAGGASTGKGNLGGEGGGAEQQRGIHTASTYELSVYSEVKCRAIRRFGAPAFKVKRQLEEGRYLGTGRTGRDRTSGPSAIHAGTCSSRLPLPASTLWLPMPHS